jgi:methionyl-tRNA synthetase
VPEHFYLTTTLPYVNAKPHIGFALEIVAADVIARYQRLLGKTVVFNTGTDEHGQKIYQEATAVNQDPQTYCDEYAAKFSDLKELLNLSYSHFIRTTDAHHVAAAQEFWLRSLAKGDIYKKQYRTKYCVGCELEKTDSELVDGKCPLHPNKELEIREEENYFFKFSRYQQPLLDWYETHADFVLPAFRLKEIKSFVAGGLQDFSISRLKAKMPWGVDVPNDPDHVMYVWFDALINYISTLGWPEDTENFHRYWPGTQLAGKDNLRQQAAMWQAMLLSADLPLSKQILINGFIGVNGQKMSKSLGNVISPEELVTRYSRDGARFLLMNLGPFGEDMDVSFERLDQEYTAYLSNGYGNLCSRIAKLAEKHELGEIGLTTKEFAPEFKAALDQAAISTATAWLKQEITQVDQYLSETKPWQMSDVVETKQVLTTAIKQLLTISWHLQPFLPEVSKKILTHFQAEKITALAPLFPRVPTV